MENGCDFLDWVGPDMSACVFRHLDDPADIIRAAAVSRSWNKFVISNNFVKNLCIRLCPEVSNLVSNGENDHNIYTCLIQNLVFNKEMRSCILKCMGASSTDRFPDEHIENTLESEDRVRGQPSYWSSKGGYHCDMYETLTYCLVSALCIVDEIKIRPWLATDLQYCDSIHSAKFVRFRIGCTKINQSHLNTDDNYVWTYTSPEFPLEQENVLQSFKLPRPVLGIGGIVQIELIQSAQRCSMDNLYYICISHVQVIGRPVSGLALSISGFPIQYSITEAQSSNNPRAI